MERLAYWSCPEDTCRPLAKQEIRFVKQQNTGILFCAAEKPPQALLRLPTYLSMIWDKSARSSAACQISSSRSRTLSDSTMSSKVTPAVSSSRNTV